MPKTKDGRFIERRILIDKEVLRKLITFSKERNNLTSTSLARLLGVSAQMIRHDWLNENRTIPLSVLNKLFKLSKIESKERLLIGSQVFEPFWGQRLMGGKLKVKKVAIPKKEDERFAEFYGILLGDGCVFSGLNGFSISGNKFLDYFYYYDYLKELIFYLFKIYPSIYVSKKDKSVKCVVYSKTLARYLASVGFPVGMKYQKSPIIPEFISNKRKNLAACIRGLMDTDGSLSGHPHSKIMIHLSITIKSLRDSVERGLEKLKIKPGTFEKGIMIYGEKKIRMFNQVVGFSNYKNIYKYGQFKKTGSVPKSKEVEMFIRDKIKQNIQDHSFIG